MSRKSDLLKLFSQNTNYYFHIIPNDLGHLIYVTQERTDYSVENLEFKLNSIIEGFMNKPEDIKFEKVAPSIYFTDEKNTEKLKYALGEDMMENSNFSSFIEDIKEVYRTLEVEDFLIYKKDPDAYKKKKEEEYKQQQLDAWNRYKKQVEEQERIKRNAISQYDGDLAKIFYDNLLPTIIRQDKKFKLKEPFSKLVYSILTNDEEQGLLWPTRDNQTIVGNDKFDVIEIEGNSMTILLADRMSDTYSIKFELSNSELNIVDVNQVDKNIEHMTDYDFLMKVYDFDISSNFMDWEHMYENEKLDAVIDEIIRLDIERLDKKKKMKNEYVDASMAKAFFTIDSYEIQIGKIPGVISENISDDIFKPIESIITELGIEFKRGSSYNNIEFIETITRLQVEKIYKLLIENGYMLDTYRQEDEYSFMDLRKPNIPNNSND